MRLRRHMTKNGAKSTAQMWMRKKSLAAPMAAGICPPRRLWTEASSRVSSSERRPTSGGRHMSNQLSKAFLSLVARSE